MRFLLLIALVFPAALAFAQADVWNVVSPQAGPERLQPAYLSDAQLKSLARLIRRQKPEDIWECEAADIDALIKGLRFEAIPTASQQKVVLVEAPAGCARGGQGANGAMWVIRFDGDAPLLLATPKQFSGWLFSVRASLSHDYPDIILGWHMSAEEANLAYFRFDGKSYRSISTAKLLTDDQEKQKIVPNKK